MKKILRNLARGGDISWLSYYFADFIAQQSNSDIDDLPALSAALISEHNQAGDVCVDLADYANRPLFDSSWIEADQVPTGIDAADWCARLGASGVLGQREQPAPLRLEGTRLYLYRYWFYEDSVARWLLGPGLAPTADAVAGDTASDDSGELDEDQRAAVITAARHRFCVISGGPGSGKTSTVVRILAVLLAQNPECRIALAAPTGKAAARLTESIRARIDQPGLAETVGSALPGEATTLHRLLGYRGRDFGYHEQRRLAFDCVIVDEASMIDLKLMHHLLSALPEHARLILLGDRDQLASVAAGNVLGDITGHGQDIARGGSALAKSIALLRGNYRFDRDSAIGELATLTNKGRSDAALDLLRQQQRGLRWYQPGEAQLDAGLLDFILARYQAIFDSRSPLDALKAFSSMRVLSATNLGACGVDSLNQLISLEMRQRNRIADGDLFHGLPIMITRNQQQLGLYNGDIGILWQNDRGLRACFDNGESGIREFAINRLPGFVPAWASTVHKSQGSEFETVVLALPQDPASNALTRELIYTAITRARHNFVLQAAEPVFAAAVDRLSRRHSGLAGKLDWLDPDASAMA